MKKSILLSIVIGFTITLQSCSTKKTDSTTENSATENETIIDRFADIQVLRYQIEGFEKLSLNQKKLVYFMVQAGLSGRKMFRNYRWKLQR